MAKKQAVYIVFQDTRTGDFFLDKKGDNLEDWEQMASLSVDKSFLLNLYPYAKDMTGEDKRVTRKKRIELSADEIDTLMRIMDTEIQDQTDFKNDHGHSKAFKAEIQECITILRRLKRKLGRMVNQAETKGPDDGKLIAND